MSEAEFRVIPLDAAHSRAEFSSGSEQLERYFRQQVTQDIRRRVTACFVAITRKHRIAGYYTLAAASMLLTDLPPSIGKKLPRYPLLPAVRMGRLAVDQDFKRQGLGGALLADALSCASDSEIAAYALVVDAKDEGAAAFYQHHGFILLPNSPLTLFLPLATASTDKLIDGTLQIPNNPNDSARSGFRTQRNISAIVSSVNIYVKRANFLIVTAIDTMDGKSV